MRAMRCAKSVWNTRQRFVKYLHLTFEWCMVLVLTQTHIDTCTTSIYQLNKVYKYLSFVDFIRFTHHHNSRWFFSLSHTLRILHSCTIDMFCFHWIASCQLPYFIYWFIFVLFPSLLISSSLSNMIFSIWLYSNEKRFVTFMYHFIYYHCHTLLPHEHPKIVDIPIYIFWSGLWVYTWIVVHVIKGVNVKVTHTKKYRQMVAACYAWLCPANWMLKTLKDN